MNLYAYVCKLNIILDELCSVNKLFVVDQRDDIKMQSSVLSILVILYIVGIKKLTKNHDVP